MTVMTMVMVVVMMMMMIMMMMTRDWEWYLCQAGYEEDGERCVYLVFLKSLSFIDGSLTMCSNLFCCCCCSFSFLQPHHLYANANCLLVYIYDIHHH